MKDYKAKKRKLFHTPESLELLRTKRKETMQDTLDRIGYIDEKDCKDKISFLGW